MLKTKEVFVLSALLAGGVGCGSSSSGTSKREQVAITVRGNLEKACTGQPECLQAINQHFDACLEEYIAETERTGEADPKVMAGCMNRRSGREWFKWRAK